MLLLAVALVLFALVSPAISQSPCGTDQNPYCKGNKIFEQICCPSPNVCYWQDRDGTPGCCPAGQVCDGSSPYYPSSITPTVKTSTIHPSTITITPTQTTNGGGGGVIIITTSPNGPSVITITTQPQTTLTGACLGGCATVTSVVGGVYSTITQGAGGAYSTVTSVVGGGFSTVTSGAASVFSSVSGVLVGQPSAASSSAVLSKALLVLTGTIGVLWSIFG